MIRFHHPALLIAIIAAILPVLIYLLTRDRVRVVPFSTLRFFAGDSARLVRRKRWLETLLLAMRALLIAMIVVAFARPFLRESANAGDARELDEAVVLLLDVSQSMSRPGAWDAAVNHARDAADSGAISLVAFDSTPQVLAHFTDASTVRARLPAISPGASGTNLVAALRKADELLNQVAANKKRIVLVSDLPRAGFTVHAAGWKLSPGVSLEIHSVSPPSTPPVAIVEADFPQSLVNNRAPQPITVRIANFTDETVTDIAVELAIPGQETRTRTLTIPANARVTAGFRAVFTQPGDHPGTLTLTASAAPAGLLYLNPHVMPRIGVTILAPDDEIGRRDGAAFFLSKAIRPSAESPFALRTVATSSHTIDLSDASVLILADVPALSPSLRQAVADFHRRGGGILLMPGARTQPQAFSDAFGDFAPCRLRRVIDARESRRGDARAIITRVELEHPVFEVFQPPHNGDFSTVAISRYWEVTDSQLARVPLRLDDGRPFMLEKSSPGVGSCVLLTSPADPSWNNLPQRAIFLPLLHQTLRHLAVRAERPTACEVGQALSIPDGMTLRDPSGTTHDGAAIIATVPGHHTLLDENGQNTFVYAVNTPLSEFDADTIPPDELIASLEAPATASATAGAGKSLFIGGGREFWMLLTGLSLMLLIMELYVSNKVPRH